MVGVLMAYDLLAIMQAGGFISSIATMPRGKSREGSSTERKRPYLGYLGRLLILAFALAAAQAKSARAEICIQGVHDCVKTKTTAEGGFDPQNPWVQKKPTPESTIEFLQYFSMPCLPIVLGDRNTRPSPGYYTLLKDLQSAGIITYRLLAPTSGDSRDTRVDVRLSPSIGPEHFKAGAGTCLKTQLSTNFAITGWEQKDILNYKGAKVPVIIAYGTAENVDFDSVYLQYLKAKGGPPLIVNAKFRLLYIYQDRHSAWRMIVMDVAEVGESDFRTNHVNEYLQRM